MSKSNRDQTVTAVSVHNRDGRGPVLIVCEHASNYIPPGFGSLGLSPELLTSHIAWDPGALAIARHLSLSFDAPLVTGELSRLLFDCNRPPEAKDAIPEHSENHEIPGNQKLGAEAREERITTIHDPFRSTLSEAVARFSKPPLLITVHSFTPVYLGKARGVELGLIHDADDRLAGAMLECAPEHTKRQVALNDPYGPEHGVTHTLRAFAEPVKALNIMLEVRNDLIRTEAQQKDMGDMLARWITAAAARINVTLPMNAISCPEL